MAKGSGIKLTALMDCRVLFIVLAALFILSPHSAGAATLKPETLEAWEIYVQLTEERIAAELGSGLDSALVPQPDSGAIAAERFLVQDFLPGDKAGDCRKTVFSGEVYVTKMKTRDEDGSRLKVPKGLIHHWFGSVLVPGVKLADLLEWLQRYSDHENYFEEVETSTVLGRDGDRFDVFLRLKRTKIITVHYNTEHRIKYRHHDSQRVSSRSLATKIAQIENQGTPEELEKPQGDDSGFLWRLNSYWRFQEVSEGVIVECESISLSRGIPLVLKWIVGPYVNSVPEESMKNTLASIRDHK